MAKIILSYRRLSYDAIAGRIRDKLAVQYGSDVVYMDVDNIPFGTDFRQHIDEALATADMVVAVIGPKWLGPIRGRKPRIFDDTDPVRIEIETAIKRKIAVIPILVDGTKMPKPEELPDSIKQLAYTNAAVVDAGRDFHQHMERVIRTTNTLLPKAPEQNTPTGEKTSGRASRYFGWLRSAKAFAGLAAAGIAIIGALWGGFDRLAQFKFSRQAVERVDRQVVTPATTGKRVALVIGNSVYQNVPAIKNTVNDAHAISTMFASIGYTVIKRTNISRAAFLQALSDFRKDAFDAEIVVVYYAGHALEMGGKNYLIATDARIESSSDVEANGVLLNDILDATQGATRLRLILLDACRDNPFVIAGTGRGSRGITPSIISRPVEDVHEVGLAIIKPQQPNTMIAYAAKDGEVAADGDGDDSPFATALVKHLPTPDIDVRIALGRVRDDVVAMTAGRQEPYVYGSLGGETVSMVPKSSSAR